MRQRRVASAQWFPIRGVRTFARALQTRGIEMSDTDSCTEEILTYIVIRNRRKKTRRARRFWVRPILTKRRQQGEYHQLLQEMRLSDPESHFRYLRMSKERFDTLLAKVGSNACQIWFNLYINYYNYFLWGLYNIRI